MKMSVLAIALLSIGVAGSAQAASFLNGGFEDGTTSNWTIGSGSLPYNTPTGTATGQLALNPASYVGSGNWQGAVTSAGTDSITGLSTVRYGDHSVRVNNNSNDYSVNVISQTVNNYDGTSINFSWAAVLADSHGITDSDIFGLKVTDLSNGAVLYNATYSSASTSALFSTAGNWYYTQWQDITLAVTQGHNFKVDLLAADCPYGGHAGYVYLDGFGTVSGGPGDNGTGGTVPEPGSLALAGLGLMAAFGVRRRKSA